MHSNHYKYLLSSFDGTWITNAVRNGHHELRNAENYHVPMAYSNFIDRFPLFSLPREWNLAGPSKFHSNQLTFKLKPKLELLEEP
jgi:hypothetical protein